MFITRRHLLQYGVAAALLGGPAVRSFATAEEPGDRPGPGIRVGARLGSMGGKLEVAGQCGIDGVELPVGKGAPKLHVADPTVREEYLRQCNAMNVLVSSLTMDLLNDNPLATDPLGPDWLHQSIEAAHDLGASRILVAFFGKGDLTAGKEVKKPELENVIARLKEAAPAAQKAGVVLGVESRLDAAQNLDLLDRVGSDAVRVYYDIGNLSNLGHDVPAEIRRLKGRICCFHFKDNPGYLGEGKIKLGPIADAVRAIDYKGWIVLETNCPSKDGAADCRRNAMMVRKLFGLPPR